MLANAAVVSVVALYFEHAELFHISYFTCHLRYNRLRLKAIKNVLTSHIKLCYVYVNSNEPIKVAHLQKLANQSMLNVALLIEMVNNSFSESKKNFARLIKKGMF